MCIKQQNKELRTNYIIHRNSTDFLHLIGSCKMNKINIHEHDNWKLIKKIILVN
jgi:hypothetical protein